MKQSGRFAVPWKTVIHNFFHRELLSILFWASLGAIAAALVRALISDHSSDPFLFTTYLPPPKRFDEPARYRHGSGKEIRNITGYSEGFPPTLPRSLPPLRKFSKSSGPNSKPESATMLIAFIRSKTAVPCTRCQSSVARCPQLGQALDLQVW